MARQYNNTNCSAKRSDMVCNKLEKVYLIYD